MYIHTYTHVHNSAGCGYYLLYQAFEKSQKELEKRIDELAKVAKK